MNKVRVLRLLEYTFDTPEDAEKHMSNFGVPANGISNRGIGMVIRSSIIIDLNNIQSTLTPTDTELELISLRQIIDKYQEKYGEL